MYIFFKYKICYILYVLPIGQKKNAKNKIPKVDIEIIYNTLYRVGLSTEYIN